MSKLPQAFDEDAWQRWFQNIWEHREEKIFRGYFGNIGEKIHNVPAQAFTNLGVPPSQVDPRWLTHGVLECPPTGAAMGRTGWLYVTSGLSNPWGQRPDQVKPDDFSGLGMELIIEAPEQAPWALSTLFWLTAIQIMVGVGAVQGELLHLHDRVPLQTSIDAARPDSPLRNLIIAAPPRVEPRLHLDSGLVDLLLCVGITDREMDFARTQGGNVLIDLLTHHEVYPVTDPSRASVI